MANRLTLSLAVFATLGLLCVPAFAATGKIVGQVPEQKIGAAQGMGLPVSAPLVSSVNPTLPVVLTPPVVAPAPESGLPDSMSGVEAKVANGAKDAGDQSGKKKTSRRQGMAGVLKTLFDGTSASLGAGVSSEDSRDFPGDNALVTRSEARARLGVNPRRLRGELLSDPLKSDWATTRRVRAGKIDLVVKVYQLGLPAGAGRWSPALLSLQQELFIRQVISRFFSHALAAPRSFGYPSGWVKRKGVLAMEHSGYAPDPLRWRALPFKTRGALAALAQGFGLQDVAPYNLLLPSADVSLFRPEGRPILIDFEKPFAPNDPGQDSGTLAEKPWVSEDYFNTLDGEYREEVDRWVAEFNKPGVQNEIEGMLRSVGMGRARRRSYMALFQGNMSRLKRAIQTDMRNAHWIFTRKIHDKGLPYEKVGILSEINRAVQSSENGGLLRDIARALIGHDQLRELGRRASPYVLHPSELVLLLRSSEKNPGGRMSEEDYRKLQARLEGGGWFRVGVTEAMLRNGFNRLNSWLAKPPRLPGSP